MKTSYINFHMLVVLMTAATLTACSGDDSIIDEQQPTYPNGTYTMTVSASKGGDASTRALSPSGSALNATWAMTENIYVKKGETWATGSLQPQDNAATATLKGALSGISIAENDDLTLQFPKSGDITYAGQVGTLADIAANFDYATATVEVESVSATGNINPKAATTTFQNQQAIIKFTLKKSDGSALPANPTAFTISDGTSTVSLTSIPTATYTTNGAGVLYVAFPAAGTSKTVTLTATVGDDTYTCEKSGVTFTNGQYYTITVKMTKEQTDPTSLSELKTLANSGSSTSSYLGYYVTSTGAISSSNTSAIGQIVYISSSSDVDTSLSGSRILVMQTSDSSSKMQWSTLETSVDITDITAIDLMNGCAMTQALHTKNSTRYPAANYAWTISLSAVVTGSTRWFLPSYAQWRAIKGTDGIGADEIATLREKTGIASDRSYWSSREVYDGTASKLLGSSGYFISSPKTGYEYVRAIFAY